MAKIQAVAKELNVTARRVHQLVEEGMPKEARGEFDIGKCSRWFIRRLQDELERRGPGGTIATAGMAAEREGLVAAQRLKTEMENAVRSGELAERQDVRKQWSLLVTNAQKRLRSIPAAIGPQLTNIPSPMIVDRLKKEIDAALNELAAD